MLLFSAAQRCGLQDCVCTTEQEARVENTWQNEQKLLSSDDRITLTGQMKVNWFVKFTWWFGFG